MYAAFVHQQKLDTASELCHVTFNFSMQHFCHVCMDDEDGVVRSFYNLELDFNVSFSTSQCICHQY